MKQRGNSAQSIDNPSLRLDYEAYILLFRMLLKSGADANLAMADGRTPIHIAAESGNIGVIKLLLENDADILATDEVKVQRKQSFWCLFSALGWRNCPTQSM